LAAVACSVLLTPSFDVISNFKPMQELSPTSKSCRHSHALQQLAAIAATDSCAVCLSAQTCLQPARRSFVQPWLSAQVNLFSVSCSAHLTTLHGDPARCALLASKPAPYVCCAACLLRLNCAKLDRWRHTASSFDGTQGAIVSTTCMSQHNTIY
jgi:hypothetical protein